MNEVREAYREAVKRCHPDGTEPDEAEFRRVQIAYEVLGNPTDRAKYDEYDSTRRWVDDLLVDKLMANMGIRQTLRDASLVTEFKAELMKANEAERQSAPDWNPSFTYFYYEGETVPEESVRNSWIEILKAAAWSIPALRGKELKVGFTERPFHILTKKWGKVLMLSGTPNAFTAMYLLGQL